MTEKIVWCKNFVFIPNELLQNYLIPIKNFYTKQFSQSTLQKKYFMDKKLYQKFGKLFFCSSYNFTTLTIFRVEKELQKFHTTPNTTTREKIYKKS